MEAARALFTAVALIAGGATLAAGGKPATASPAQRSTDAGCVAIVQPITEGLPGKAADVAGGVRDLMAGYLAGSSLKVVALESPLPSQAVVEARQKDCDLLLYLKLTRKTGGGRLAHAFGRAAGSAAWALPGTGSLAGTAGRIATSAGLQTAASLAESTKASDEAKLEYRLQSTSGEVQFGPKSEHQKASVDGEDIVTPVIARAAEAIVSRQAHQ
jgi:hypothetical protein